MAYDHRLKRKFEHAYQNFDAFIAHHVVQSSRDHVCEVP